MSETVVSHIATKHWRDKVCVACKGPLPLPTWQGQPYICCSGLDCGCQGGILPVEFCSVDCWENYEPLSDGEIAEEQEIDELADLHDTAAERRDDILEMYRREY